MSCKDTEGTMTNNVNYIRGTYKGNLAIVADDSDEENHTDGSVLNLKSYKDANGNTYAAQTIHTYEKMSFRYGYLEMRAKVPSVQGAWPAFWIRSGDAYSGKTPFGEIDIFEVYGTHYKDAEKPGYGVIDTTFHKWLGGESRHCASGTNSAKGFELISSDLVSFDPNEYHIFAMEWTPETITFYLDDEVYYKVDMTVDMCGHDANKDGIPDHKDYMSCFNDNSQQYFLLISNLVFNSMDDDWAPDQCISKTENFEANYYIDYVRLYQNPLFGEKITLHNGCVHAPDIY